MKFASRLLSLKPEGAYVIMNQANALEAKGKHIIHFEIGQPYAETPAHISLAGIKAITEGKTRYSSPLGIMELRQEVAAYLTASRHIQVAPQEIAITPSAKPTIFLAMASVLEPGDEVIIPNPGFPSYEILTHYFEAIPRLVPLTEANNFSFDMEQFAAAINAKTKLIILNSPSNPTGAVIPLKDLKIIAGLAKEYHSFIFSDESYSSIIYDKKSYSSIYSLPGMKQQVVLSDGFSKTFAMPGWRLGYMTFPKKIEPQMEYLMTHTFGCTATFTQYAGLMGLRSGLETSIKMTADLQIRRDLMVKALNDIPGIKCHTPQGAFYVFPNITAFGKTSAVLAEYILNKANVALLSGTAFGSQGEGYLRLSYSTKIENILEGTKRMKQALAKLPRTRT